MSRTSESPASRVSCRPPEVWLPAQWATATETAAPAAANRPPFVRRCSFRPGRRSSELPSHLGCSQLHNEPNERVASSRVSCRPPEVWAGRLSGPQATETAAPRRRDLPLFVRLCSSDPAARSTAADPADDSDQLLVAEDRVRVGDLDEHEVPVRVVRAHQGLGGPRRRTGPSRPMPRPAVICQTSPGVPSVSGAKSSSRPSRFCARTAGSPLIWPPSEYTPDQTPFGFSCQTS